jgi:hypothetical protein
MTENCSLGSIATARAPSAFDEELAIDFAERVDVDVADLGQRLEFIEPCPDLAFDAQPILIGTASDEGEIGEVAGQSDPAADHDIRFGARTAQPFAASPGKLVKGLVSQHAL